jgi:drug/metabolite transporter (DMT)-like permease
MSAPLLITALSVLLLRDRVEWRRWVAVLVGMVGVMIVLRPTGVGLVTLGGLAALGAALGYAVSAITIRILARTDSSGATVLWALLLMTIFSGILAAPGWAALRVQDWLWICGLGLSGAFGQYFITDAFRRAQPAVIAPLEYTALAWGMMFDWLIWNTSPSTRMLAGASIIVASGLYVIRRERAAESPVEEKTDAVSRPS